MVCLSTLSQLNRAELGSATCNRKTRIIVAYTGLKVHFSHLKEVWR